MFGSAADMCCLSCWSGLSCRPHCPQVLAEASGTGIMCAVAAAFPDLYLGQPPGRRRSRPSEAPFPPDELEFDMQGCIELHNSSKATIDVAEVKTSLNYSAAIPQLGMRLGVLAWVVHSCYGVPFDSMTLTGRLFVPRHQASRLDKQQRELAQEAWVFSARIHGF